MRLAGHLQQLNGRRPFRVPGSFNPTLRFVSPPPRFSSFSPMPLPVWAVLPRAAWIAKFSVLCNCGKCALCCVPPASFRGSVWLLAMCVCGGSREHWLLLCGRECGLISIHALCMFPACPFLLLAIGTLHVQTNSCAPLWPCAFAGSGIEFFCWFYFGFCVA